jgi:hypothetical protein
MKMMKYLQHISVEDPFEVNDKHYDKASMHLSSNPARPLGFEPRATQSKNFFHDVKFSIKEIKSISFKSHSEKKEQTILKNFLWHSIISEKRMILTWIC